MHNVIEIKNISKTFPGGVKANDGVNISVKKGEIHALLGENGAGKSTIMSILFGLYKPDSGEIMVNGKKLDIKNPRNAVEAGISMLPQHFRLMDNISVWRNIVLGYETSKIGVLNKSETIKKLNEIGGKANIKLDWEKKVNELSVSEKQKVELMKMLWKDVEILIFDEPTSILTPDQTKEFLNMCKDFKKKGKTILIITHKIDEIQEIADSCTILRKGKTVETVNPKNTSDEKLVELMVGEKVDLNLSTIKKSPVGKETIVEISKLSYDAKKSEDKPFQDIDIQIKKGEILGIAAVEGNGQSALFKVLGGLVKPTSGQVQINDVDTTGTSPEKLYEDYEGRSLISHIPEDRQENGLVLSQKCGYNLILQDVKKFTKFGFLQESKIDKHLNEIKSEYDIRGIVNKKTTVGELSGGNQQKVIIAREIERHPHLILAKHPTRGLDVGAIRNVYENLIEARNSGTAVLLSSGELDEIIQVSDRIAVMSNGKIVKIIDAKGADKIKLGKMMMGGASHG